MRRIIEALEHLIAARARLRKAYQIMREEVPEMADAIAPAGAQITAILLAVKSALDARRAGPDSTVGPDQRARSSSDEWVK